MQSQPTSPRHIARSLSTPETGTSLGPGAGWRRHVYTVGTFGVASASKKLVTSSRCTRKTAPVSHGNHVASAGCGQLPSPKRRDRTTNQHSLFSLSSATAGVPLSWGNSAGGDIVRWVGFELSRCTHVLGISARRADWFIRWTRKAPRELVQST